MGEESTSIRRVEEHSETIDLYPDLAFLKREAAARDRTDFAIRPTLGRRQVSSFDVDPIFLGLAMRFRRGCMDGAAYSRMDFSSIISSICSRTFNPSPHAGHGLRRPMLRKVCEYVEAHLAEPLTLQLLCRSRRSQQLSFQPRIQGGNRGHPLAVRSQSKNRESQAAGADHG